MLRHAKRARNVLNDSGESTVSFVRSLLLRDGGFRGRGPQSDLYYTVFALEALLVLDADPPLDKIENYLLSFGNGESLDLVHLACLGRCWADLPGGEPPAVVRRAITARIESCRLGSGGYGSFPGNGDGSIYNGFLALGAYQDLGQPLPEPALLVRSTLPGPDDPTPLLSGAVILLEELGAPVPGEWTERLFSRFLDTGGFAALPGLPVADLLSTASALHALRRAGSSLERIKAPCLEFILSLRGDAGGFRGLSVDDRADAEYTFYGLLAAGHLAE